MKKPFRFIQGTIAATMIASLLMPAPAYAQAYTSQLRFLEDFAIKLYQRGDYAAANTEFQRILRIDPNSQVARQYMAQMQKNPPVKTPTTLERADNIVKDINALKADIVKYERDLDELEALIRTLINENDDLYMALNKRTREVMELREALYKTPYSQQYKSMMDSLPVERVPQRTYRYEDALLSESPRRETATAPASQNVQPQTTNQGQAAQAETRGALIDKTLTLMEKKDNLSSAKDNLLVINRELKAANNRYLELINQIERYYQSIKAEVATDKYNEQLRYSQLFEDYVRQNKELEALRQKVSESAKPAANRAAQQPVVAETEPVVVTPREPVKATVQPTVPPAKPEAKPAKPAPAARNPAPASAPKATPQPAVAPALTAKPSPAPVVIETEPVIVTPKEPVKAAKPAPAPKAAPAPAPQVNKPASVETRPAAPAPASAEPAWKLLNEPQSNLGAPGELTPEMREWFEAQHKKFEAVMADYKTRSTELEVLKQNIAEREAALQQQAKRVPAQDAKLKDLDLIIAAKDRELADLKMQLVRSREEMGSRDAQTSRQNEDLRRASLSLDQLDQQAAAIQKQLAENDHVLVALESSLIRQNEDQALARRNADMADHLSEELAKKNSQLETARQNTTRLAKELQDLRASSEGREADIADQEARIKALEDRVSQATLAERSRKAEAESLAQELTQFKRDNERLSREAFERDQRLAELKDRVTYNEAKASDLQRKLAASQDTALDLEEKLAANVRRPADVETAKLEEINAQLFQRNQALQEARLELAAKDAQINTLNKQINDLRRDLALLDRNVQGRDALSDELEKLSSKLQTEKKAASAHDVELKMLNSLLEEQKKKHEQQYVEAEKNVTSARNELQNKELDLKEKDLALEHLRKLLADKSLALATAQEQIKMLSEKAAALENKNQASRMVFDKRDQEHLKTENLVKQLRAELNESLKERKDLAVELDKALALAGKNEKISEENRRRHLDSQKTIADLRADLSTADRLLKSHDSDASTINKLKDELCKRDAVITDLQTRLTALTKTSEDKRQVEQQERIKSIIEKARQKAAEGTPAPAAVPSTISATSADEDCPNCKK